MLRAQADKLQALRLDAFSADSPDDLQARLRKIRFSSRALLESLGKAEALDFQIRNFYPYPLAFPYRTLAAFTNPSDLYREQLRLAENILAFLASVSLALIEASDRKNSSIDLHQYWRGGISPGDWRELSQRAAKILHDYQDHRLAESLSNLWLDRQKRDFIDITGKLIEAKNDFKHDRGPRSEEDFIEATGHLERFLIACIGHLAFLTEHPIRLVRDMDTVRGSRIVVLNALRCVGDHPGMAQERINYPEPLTKNDLYVQVGKERWVSLYPFVVPRNCPQCKTREIYFVDKWQGQGKPAQLKSFERGHTEQDKTIGSAFEEWSMS